MLLKTIFGNEYFAVDPEWFGGFVTTIQKCSIGCADEIYGPLYFLDENTKIFEYNEKNFQQVFSSKVFFLTVFNLILNIIFILLNRIIYL